MSLKEEITLPDPPAEFLIETYEAITQAHLVLYGLCELLAKIEEKGLDTTSCAGDETEAPPRTEAPAKVTIKEGALDAMSRIHTLAGKIHPATGEFLKEKTDQAATRQF